jgi:hypothetical protein
MQVGQREEEDTCVDRNRGINCTYWSTLRLHWESAECVEILIDSEIRFFECATLDF